MVPPRARNSGGSPQSLSTKPLLLMTGLKAEGPGHGSTAPSSVSGPPEPEYTCSGPPGASCAVNATTPASLIVGVLRFTSVAALRAISTAPLSSNRTTDDVESPLVTSAATWPAAFIESAGASAR